MFYISAVYKEIMTHTEFLNWKVDMCIFTSEKKNANQLFSFQKGNSWFSSDTKIKFVFGIFKYFFYYCKCVEIPAIQSKEAGAPSATFWFEGSTKNMGGAVKKEQKVGVGKIFMWLFPKVWHLSDLRREGEHNVQLLKFSPQHS